MLYYFFSPKIVLLDNIEKYGKGVQATDDNVAHCILGRSNTYCISLSTVVTTRRRNITLRCLSCVGVQHKISSKIIQQSIRADMNSWAKLSPIMSAVHKSIYEHRVEKESSRLA